MTKTVIMAFVLGSLFTACSATKEIKERKDPHSYRQQLKADARMKSDQQRMDRENYKQLKRMEHASNKQNRGGWDTNKLGNVFGL
jgi:hypothetical protein